MYKYNQSTPTSPIKIQIKQSTRFLIGARSCLSSKGLLSTSTIRSLKAHSNRKNKPCERERPPRSPNWERGNNYQGEGSNVLEKGQKFSGKKMSFSSPGTKLAQTLMHNSTTRKPLSRYPPVMFLQPVP